MSTNKYVPYNYVSDKPIKAMLPGPEHRQSNAYDLSNNKELTNRFRACVSISGVVTEIIDCRLFMGRSSQASVVYCALWVLDRKHDIYTSGKGQAGGYGYHKGSAAVCGAIENAGIKLHEPISGVGDTAIHRALVGIVRACGYKGKVTIL